MSSFALAFGALLIFAILWDAFETIIVPRRATRIVGLTSLVYRLTWAPWSGLGQRVSSAAPRETFLSFYGPISVLIIVAVWAVGMVAGFGVLQWGAGSLLSADGHPAGLADDLYMSGTTFFTLGIGDVTPNSTLARVLTVVETGTGFAFLAIVVAYLPVQYQAFSRREVHISLLDGWAGSPPTAAELLRRVARDGGVQALEAFLHEWEVWCAELLESHISYPALAYFRSQHQRQSWVAGLTSILDVCALLLAGIDGLPAWQAQLTFAIARHAAVDLTQTLNIRRRVAPGDRLPPEDLARLRSLLAGAGVRLREGEGADQRLRELRRLYEPFVARLSVALLMALPPWMPAPNARDNWQTTAKREDRIDHF